MTWTLSSDWCISRRIASQIKRSSTLESPLTTSPHPCRRRTVVRRHQLSSIFHASLPIVPLFVYLSIRIVCACLVFRSCSIHIGKFIGKSSVAGWSSWSRSFQFANSVSRTFALRETRARLCLLCFAVSRVPIQAPIIAKMNLLGAEVESRFFIRLARRRPGAANSHQLYDSFTIKYLRALEVSRRERSVVPSLMFASNRSPMRTNRVCI